MVKKTSAATARNVSVTSKEATHIAGNTQVLFTIKTFFSLIGAILTLFIGFYVLVIVPKIDNAKESCDEKYTDQTEINTAIWKEIGIINTKIGIEHPIIPLVFPSIPTSTQPIPH